MTAITYHIDAVSLVAQSLQALSILIDVVLGLALHLRNLHTQRLDFLVSFRLHVRKHDTEAPVVILQTFLLATHVIFQNGHLFANCLQRILQTLVSVLTSAGFRAGGHPLSSQERELFLEYSDLGVRGSKLLRKFNCAEAGFFETGKIAIQLGVCKVELVMQMVELRPQDAFVGVADRRLEPGDLQFVSMTSSSNHPRFSHP